MAENVGRSFKHFLEFSSEIRTEIINEMPSDDRCRFTRCSKLSNQEAKASKNYIFGVYVICVNVGVSVYLKFDESGVNECYFSYYQFFGEAIKLCKTWDHRELWKDFCHCVNEDIGRLFQSYQNSIRRLSIRDSSLKKLDLKIELLKNLEDLELIGDNDAHKILSKLQKPLKELWIDEVGAVNCEQIYQVEQELTLLNAPLNNQQFLRISAYFLTISIGHLTEKDIFSFIRSWQNGTLRRELGYCQWMWKGSNFNKEVLSRLLRLPEVDLNPENGEEEFEFEIKHFKEPGKIALLYFREEFLEFDTIDDEDDVQHIIVEEL